MRRDILKVSLSKGIGLMTVLLLLSFSKAAFAATITWDGGCGADTNWSCASNWDLKRVPEASDSVVLNSGSESTIDDKFTGSIADLTVNAGFKGTIRQQRSLIISGSFAQGAFTLRDGTFISEADIMLGWGWNHAGGTFTQTAGTVIFHTDTPCSLDVASSLTSSFNNITINKPNGRVCNLFNSGTILVNNQLACLDGSLARYSGSGPFRVDGTISQDAGCDGGNAVVEVIGSKEATSTLTSPGEIFGLDLNAPNHTLLVSGSGTLTFGGNTTLRQGLFDAGSASLTFPSLTIAGGTFEGGPSTATYTVSTVYTQSGGTFSGKSATLSLGAGLTLSGGTFNAGAGNLTVTDFSQSSGTFNGGSGTITLGQHFTLSGGSFNSTTGTFRVTGAWNHTAGGTFNHNGGLVVFYGSTSGAIDVIETETFQDLSFDRTDRASKVVMDGDTLIVLGTLRLIDGSVDNYSSDRAVIEARGSVVHDANFDGGGAIVRLTGSSDVMINSAGDFTGLRLSSVSAPVSVTGGEAMTFGGPVTIETSTLDMGEASPTLSSSLTLSGGTVNTGSGDWTINGPASVSGGTFNGGSGDMLLGTSYTQSGGAWTVGTGSLRVSESSGVGDFSVSGGTFDGSGATSIDIDRHFTQAGGTFTAPAGTLTIGAALNLSSAHDFRNGGGTIVMDGQSSCPITTTAPDVLNNLNISKTGTSCALSSNLDLDGNLTLTSGGLDAWGNTLLVAGNWASNGGTFTPRTSTVILDGSSQRITGSTTFNNIQKTVASADTLTFETGSTQTIGGTFRLEGASGQNLALRSATPGSQWRIDPQGTRTLRYLDVQDSNNINATEIATDGLNIVDSGNNTGWGFPPNISFASAASSGSEATRDVDLVVALSRTYSGDVTIDYAVTGGSASGGGIDYTLASGTLTIPTGTLSASIRFTVEDDTPDEDDETLTVTLSNPTNAVLIAPSALTYTILDNDEPPTVSVADTSCEESDDPDRITCSSRVSLSAASGKTVTVDYEMRDGTALGTATTGKDIARDYARRNGSVSIPAGSRETTITTETLDDTEIEGDEYFTVSLWGVTNGTIADGTGTVTIVDDDSRSNFSVSDVAVTETDEGTVQATFVVSLSEARIGDVAVDYTTRDESATAGADYRGVSGTLLFAAGETTKEVSVDVLPDSIAEGEEFFSLVLSNPVAAPISDDEGTATITDNDVSGVTLRESGGSTNLTEGGAVDTYTLVLNTQPTDDVEVTLEGDDQVSIDQTALTFTAENWDLPQTITVSAIDDNLAEGDHRGIIAHRVTSTDPNYTGLSLSDVEATIVDNEVAGVSVTASGGTTEVTEGAETDTYQIVLTTEPREVVTITLTSNNEATGVTLDPGVLLFTPSNWDEPQAVTVTATDDARAEGGHAATISHTAESADEDYDGIAISQMSVAITDNDQAGITIAETEGSSALDEAGDSDSFTLVLTSEPTAPVVISILAGAQLTADPAELTFTADNWQTPQSIALNAVDDEIAEGDHAATVTYQVTSDDESYNDLSVADLTVSISDNDTAPEEEPEDDGEPGDDSDAAPEAALQECVVVARNFRTGKECGRAVVIAGEPFTLSCNATLAADPNNPQNVRISLEATCGNLVLEKYFDANVSADSLADGSEQFETENVDMEETLAVALLRDQLDELGWEALDNGFAPACFATFMNDYLEDASRENSASEGPLGTLKDCIKCFMREGVRPTDLGFSSFPEMLSQAKKRELDESEIEAIALQAEAVCNYGQATSLETRLTRALDVTDSIADLASKFDHDTCEAIKENRTERDLLVQMTQALSIEALSTNGTLETLVDLMEETFEEARDDGDYTALTDDDRLLILVALIEELAQGETPDVEAIEEALEIVENLELDGDEEEDDLRAIGREIGETDEEERGSIAERCAIGSSCLDDLFENQPVDEDESPNGPADLPTSPPPPPVDPTSTPLGGFGQ